MILESLAAYFKQHLFSIPSGERLLNPYSYSHPESDIPNAPQIRQTNLLSYLSHFDKMPSILIVGEAPGPNGCRFSGVPFTSERQLAQGELPFSGQPTSNFEPPVAENSATIFWEALKPHHQRFFVWNSIPLLPHRPGEPTRLRSPLRGELFEFQPMLGFIIAALQPQKILAVGRRAEQAIKLLKRPCSYIRHPSHGGKRAFQDTLDKFFN